MSKVTASMPGIIDRDCAPEQNCGVLNVRKEFIPLGMLFTYVALEPLGCEKNILVHKNNIEGVLLMPCLPRREINGAP